MRLEWSDPVPIVGRRHRDGEKPQRVIFMPMFVFYTVMESFSKFRCSSNSILQYDCRHQLMNER